MRNSSGGRREPRIRREKDKSDRSDKHRKLKNEIDSLKREILQLRKMLNKAENLAAEYINKFEERSISKKEEKDNKKKCEECGKGELVPFVLNIRGNDVTYLTCNLCGERKVLK